MGIGYRKQRGAGRQRWLRAAATTKILPPSPPEAVVFVCAQIATAEEDGPETGEHALLEFCHTNPRRARAGATLASCLARIALAVDDGHRAAAGAAADKA